MEDEMWKVTAGITALFAVLVGVMVAGCSKPEAVQRKTVVKEDGSTVVFERVGAWEDNYNRIFSVFVSSKDWLEMETYGEEQPYRTGRTTSVLFFDDREGTPDVTDYEGSMRDVIDRIYADGDTADWVARWDRFPSGEGIFKRYPAK
jgi:hypothetical protein